MLSPMADKTGNDPTNSKSARMKSAYELALERMEQQGIERPREETLSEEFREKVAEVRSQAAAKLAELEILHGNRAKREEEEQDYVRERRRIEDDRERKIAKLRGA
jgi:hypothetical protein